MSLSLTRTEIVSVLLAAVLALVVLATGKPLPSVMHLSAAVLFAMVVWIALHDISEFIIPDGPLVCIALIAGSTRLAAAGGEIYFEASALAVDAAICGGVIWLVREGYYRLRGVDGIGFGDVKLAAAGGILTGVAGFAWALFVASAAGLLFALAVLVVDPRRRLHRLPFGAFLAPACWMLWIASQMGVR